MMNAMTITEFLEARIAEDEAVARGAGSEGVIAWRYDPTKVNSIDRGEAVFAGPRGAMAITVASTGPADDPQSMRDAAHIARHDPARVLAECQAKRAILSIPAPGWPHDDDRYTLGWQDAAEAALCALAAVYADHPDYNPAWRL